MKTKLNSKHIKFEKYDTVKIVCNGDKLTYSGLITNHSDILFEKDFTGPTEVKIIKGSQRGSNKVTSIWNAYGIKIMPIRMILIEKMKKSV